jgi:TatA/E family protein of Tat protein translocase
MLPTPGPLELVIILVIALLILGPGKLPDVGAALGKSIKEFRKASSDVQEAVTVKVDTSPLPPAPQAAPAAPAQPAPPAQDQVVGAAAAGALASHGDQVASPVATTEPAPTSAPSSPSASADSSSVAS